MSAPASAAFDERLRVALLEGGDGPAPGCPSSDALWDAVEGTLPAGAAEPLVLHAGTCAPCGRRWPSPASSSGRRAPERR